MGKGNASALRKGRFSEEGRIYLVTFVTEGRSPWFNSFELGRIVVSVMKSNRREARLLHKKPLNQIVHDVKSISAHRINRMLRRSGRISQDSFHDHAVRKHEVVGGAPPTPVMYSPVFDDEPKKGDQVYKSMSHQLKKGRYQQADSVQPWQYFTQLAG